MPRYNLMLRYFNGSGPPGSLLVTHDTYERYERPPARIHDADDYAAFETFMKTIAIKYSEKSVVFRTRSAPDSLTFRMLRFAMSDDGKNTGEVTSSVDFTTAFSGGPRLAAWELKNLAQVMAALQRAHNAEEPPEIVAPTGRAKSKDAEPDRSRFVLDGFEEKWRPQNHISAMALGGLSDGRRHEWCIESYDGGELLADGMLCPYSFWPSMNLAKHIANEFGGPVIVRSVDGPGKERWPPFGGGDRDARGREYGRCEFLVEPNATRWKR